jgi:hypothetical protein
LVYLSVLLFPNSYIVLFCKFYFLPSSVHAQTNVIITTNFLKMLSWIYVLFWIDIMSLIFCPNVCFISCVCKPDGKKCSNRFSFF